MTLWSSSRKNSNEDENVTFLASGLHRTHGNTESDQSSGAFSEIRGTHVYDSFQILGQKSARWWGSVQPYILAKSRRVPKRTALFVIVAIALLLWLSFTFENVPLTRRGRTRCPTPRLLLKPEGFKIIGIVFYGRQATVEILDCYLRKNLAINGGHLDEIHFLINTEVIEDVQYVLDLVKRVEGYKSIVMDENTNVGDYEQVWRQAVEPGHMYVKIDDDLVWMSGDAIPQIVHTLMNHPEAFLVLANLVNSAALGWVHHHQGAIYSYLPDRQPPSTISSDSHGPLAWRASALPSWQSKPEVEILEFPDTEKESPGQRAPVGSKGGPPYHDHRWLPLRDNGSDIIKTPIWNTQYDANSNDWRRWAIGAQQHYSLLENLENDALERYHFGHEGIWNMRYMHANINFMAVWSNDILDNLPFDVNEDDEAHFSIHLPRKYHRETLIQTRAIAAHFSFGTQHEMYDTDLLSRYRAYANEKICSSSNQIPIRANVA